MMTARAALLLLLLALPAPAAVPPATPAPPPAGPLIDEVLAAHGGKKTLAGITGYRMEGIVTATDPRGEAPFTRLVVRPDRLAVSIGYRGGAERRLLDRGTGWRTTQTGKPEKVTGFLLDSMVLQAARASLPWLLDTRRREVRRSSHTFPNGLVVPVLELTVKPGLLLRVYLEPETKRIGFVEGTLAVTGVSTQFRTEYSDYRRVDGVWLAHHEENFASGAHTGTTVIRSITLNPTTSNADFRP